VKRWWEGISRCGTATGLLEAEKKYRRIGLSRTPVAKGTPESIAHSAEGGQNGGSRSNFDCRKTYSAERREPLQSTKTRTSSLNFLTEQIIEVDAKHRVTPPAFRNSHISFTRFPNLQIANAHPVTHNRFTLAVCD